MMPIYLLNILLLYEKRLWFSYEFCSILLTNSDSFKFDFSVSLAILLIQHNIFYPYLTGFNLTLYHSSFSSFNLEPEWLKFYHFIRIFYLHRFLSLVCNFISSHVFFLLTVSFVMFASNMLSICCLGLIFHTLSSLSSVSLNHHNCLCAIF